MADVFCIVQSKWDMHEIKFPNLSDFKDKLGIYYVDLIADPSTNPTRTDLDELFRAR